MNQQPFRFILIGTGGISSAYIKAVNNLEGIEVSGVVSGSGKRPPGIPESISIFSSISETDCPADAVILATPNGTHRDLAMEAAKKGLHILTEKVLEITPERANQMIQTCEENNVVLAVSFQRRMSPDNETLKKLLEDDLLGKCYAASMDVRFHRDMSYYNSADYRGGWAIDGGGPFIQQAAHNADLLCWWFGLPKGVTSLLHRHSRDIESYDHGTALLQYANGLQVNFTASTICEPGFPTRFELHTEKGSLVMENDRFTEWNIGGINNPTNQDFEVHDGASSATVSDTAGHEALLRDFVDAIRNKRNPLVPAQSARMATDLVYQIYCNNQNPSFRTPYQSEA